MDRRFAHNATVNTKSPTLDLAAVGELKVWPTCRPLNHNIWLRYEEVETAIRAMLNRKAVGCDDLPTELLKVLADGEPGTLGKQNDVIVDVWRGAGHVAGIQ